MVRKITKAKQRKPRRYSDEFVAEVLRADAAPSEAGFDNVEDLLAWLEAD